MSKKKRTEKRTEQITEQRTEKLSWWDKYVLGKQTFYYQSPLSLEECAANIRKIYKFKRLFRSFEVSNYITYENDAIHFHLEGEVDTFSQHPNKIDVKGNIRNDGGRTIIVGEAIPHRLMQNLISLIMLSIFAFYFALLVNIVVVILLIVSTLSFIVIPENYMSIRRRNYMINRLEQAIGVERKRKSHD